MKNVTPNDSKNENQHQQEPATPRWVKVFGFIIIALILLVIIIMVISGGKHGPGRHLNLDDASSYLQQNMEKSVQKL